jgi:hypothetical protein
MLALRLAEELAGLDKEADEPAEPPMPIGAQVHVRGGSRSAELIRGGARVVEPSTATRKSVTAELPCVTLEAPGAA